jgi:predicted Zn-dependent protease
MESFMGRSLAKGAAFSGIVSLRDKARNVRSLSPSSHPRDSRKVAGKKVLRITAIVPATLAVLSLLAAGCSAVRPQEDADSHDPAALTVVAEIALARGDCRSASESYAEAAQRGAAPLARRASEVALSCEHVPAAWKSATRWRTLAPSDREAAAMYATVAIKLYRIADARAGIVDFARTPEGGDGTGLTELAGLLLEQSDAPAVLAAMSSALDPATISPDSEALLAELALDANDAQRAEHYAQHALERDPKQLAAKRVLARAYVMRGDATKAITVARETMRDDATHGAFELAEVLIALDRLEEAHQELERLRSTKVSSEEIDRRLALLAFDAGDMKEAQQRFSDLAAHGEVTDAALLYLADIAARDGDNDVALAGYRRLADSSLALEARSKAASILLGRGNRTEALLLLDDYVTDHPESEFQLRLSASSSYRVRPCGHPGACRPRWRVCRSVGKAAAGAAGRPGVDECARLYIGGSQPGSGACGDPDTSCTNGDS